LKSQTVSNIGRSTVKAGLKGCITVSSEAHVNDNPPQYLPDPPYNLEDLCYRKRLIQCQKLCRPALCCLKNARDNCYDSFPYQCAAYQPCNILQDSITKADEFHDTLQNSYNAVQSASENTHKALKNQHISENNDDYFDLSIEHFDTTDP